MIKIKWDSDLSSSSSGSVWPNAIPFFCFAGYRTNFWNLTIMWHKNIRVSKR